MTVRSLMLPRATTVAIVIAVALLLGACSEETPGAQAAAKALPPQVGVVVLLAEQVIINTELPGRTTPFLIAEVRPQVTGIIQKRLFDEGGMIGAGQALYQIDPAVYDAAYVSAEAALTRDRASMATAKLKADRYGKLVKTKAVSQEAYDDAVAALAEARAVVEVSKAALDAARINLDYTRVNSPISGRIGRSTVTPGALVTANQEQALATVQQLDPIYVDVRQSSTQLLRLRRGIAEGRLQANAPLEAEVELLLDDGSRYPRKGRLQFSEVTVAQSTGTVTLRAVFPNPDGVLLPGMFVRAKIAEGVREQAILVPQRGVSRDAKGQATALVLNAENQVELRRLDLERAIGNRWLVGDGLSAGDRLIVDGLQKVKAGASAAAVPFEADAKAETADANVDMNAG